MKLLQPVLILFTFICFPKCIQSAETIKEIKNFYENENTICKLDVKKYKDLVKTIDNYIQRYVSLFLITSNLQEYKVKDLNELISVDLELSLTGEDLKYLQGYSKSTKDSSYLKNLSKIDDIFSKIARLKEKSFAEEALKSTMSFFSSVNYFSIVSSPNFYMFLSALLTILVTWIIFHYLYHKHFFVFIGLTLNSLIFWESLNEYWRKLKLVPEKEKQKIIADYYKYHLHYEYKKLLKCCRLGDDNRVKKRVLDVIQRNTVQTLFLLVLEADLEIYVQTLKTGPEECSRGNPKWYNIWSYFSEDPCLQYHKNINKNLIGEVSILKCIIDTYSFYLIRTPLRIFGASVKDLTAEVTALWPSPVRYFINLPLAPFFGILIAFFILILCQKRMRLSFFGAAVEIGDVQRIRESERPGLTSSEMPKTLRVIRKLKPWTKSRFPKRLEGNLVKRKKPFLKISRTETESSFQDKQPCTNSCQNLINNEIKLE